MRVVADAGWPVTTAPTWFRKDGRARCGRTARVGRRPGFSGSVAAGEQAGRTGSCGPGRRRARAESAGLGAVDAAQAQFGGPVPAREAATSLALLPAHGAGQVPRRPDVAAVTGPGGDVLLWRQGHLRRRDRLGQPRPQADAGLVRVDQSPGPGDDPAPLVLVEDDRLPQRGVVAGEVADEVTCGQQRDRVRVVRVVGFGVGGDRQPPPRAGPGGVAGRGSPGSAGSLRSRPAPAGRAGSATAAAVRDSGRDPGRARPRTPPSPFTGPTLAQARSASRRDAFQHRAASRVTLRPGCAHRGGPDHRRPWGATRVVRHDSDSGRDGGCHPPEVQWPG